MALGVGGVGWADGAKALRGWRWLVGFRHWAQLGVWVVLVLLCSSAAAFQRAESDTIERSALPLQGQAVLELIYAGGPFPYEKDGSVFGNRERLLPPKERGYYREYTVVTPGLSHRGPRRIVCGGLEPRKPDACYYTADHYASFKLIVNSR